MSSSNSSTLMIVKIGKQTNFSSLVRDEGKEMKLKLPIPPIFLFWHLGRKLFGRGSLQGVYIYRWLAPLSIDLLLVAPPPSPAPKDQLILTRITTRFPKITTFDNNDFSYILLGYTQEAEFCFRFTALCCFRKQILWN